MKSNGFIITTATIDKVTRTIITHFKSSYEPIRML